MVSKIRTNWNRQCLFGTVAGPEEQYTTKILRPPDGCHMRGFYFRMGPLCSIESLGAFYADGALGTGCPSIQRVLQMPRIDPAHAHEHAIYFESCARLSDVQKVLFYYETDHCTGLRLFYFSGYSEVVGRVQSHHSEELTLSDGNALRRIRVIYENQHLKDVKFETDQTEGFSKDDVYDITETTVCLSLLRE
jgi:hypothetical protein